eukprot:3798994-Amphidinium_carterae.2
MFSTPVSERADDMMQYAWAPVELSYAASSETPAGLLVDPGSFGNLAGDGWVNSMQRTANRHGQSVTTEPRKQVLRVGGVGRGVDEVRTDATVPLAFRRQDGRVESGSFRTPVLPDSQCPALLGLQSLTQLGAILDCRQGILYLTGDQEGHVELPPGGQAYPLFRAPSGHLHLRIDHFDLLQKAMADGAQPVQRHLLSDRIVHSPDNEGRRPEEETNVCESPDYGPSEQITSGSVTATRSAPYPTWQ